ncbi:MAG: DUF305 domain-containing protein [Actinomycetota bacterium]|nr:DUF305 domain-containing protein [Actinomycetota bacterium]
MLARISTMRSRTAALAAVLAVGALAAPALPDRSLASAPSGARAAASAGNAQAYGKLCRDQGKRRVAGAKHTPFSACVTAMAKLADGRMRSAEKACRGLSRKRAAGDERTPFAKCVRAGEKLLHAGNGFDRAFVAEMIPHHESAVEMAQIAQRDGESSFVMDLATGIIASQTREIQLMRSIASRLDALGVKPRSLGLTRAEMGMDHDASHLRHADPFDPAFIDMMIPHHQGAIRMARVVLVRGTGAQTKRLAAQIIADQTREIDAMERHRSKASGGAPPPAPGAPDSHH